MIMVAFVLRWLWTIGWLAAVASAWVAHAVTGWLA